MQLGDIAAAVQVLQRVAEMPLPVRAAIAIRKALTSVEAEYRVFEERKNGLFQRLGEPDGQATTIPEKNRAEFERHLMDIMTTVVDATPTLIKASLLPDDLKLSVVDITMLLPLLDTDA